MSDTLERLKLARTATGCYQSMGCKFEQIIDDAADEIDRLRTELSELRAKAEAQAASVPSREQMANVHLERMNAMIADGSYTMAEALSDIDAMLAAAPSPTGLDNPEAPKS